MFFNGLILFNTLSCRAGEKPENHSPYDILWAELKWWFSQWEIFADLEDRIEIENILRSELKTIALELGRVLFAVASRQISPNQFCVKVWEESTLPDFLN